MIEKFFSWLSPKVESVPFHHKGGCGVIARQLVSAGEVVVMWGGRVIPSSELDFSVPDFSKRVLQVDEDLFLFNPLLNDPADCFNHSCDPNAGMNGPTSLIAMRDIFAGEEIAFDYAMCDGSDYDEFDCNCGAPCCRHHISGADWKNPELQRRYAGYFSPYLQRRIAASFLHL